MFLLPFRKAPVSRIDQKTYRELGFKPLKRPGTDPLLCLQIVAYVSGPNKFTQNRFDTEYLPIKEV